MQELWCPAVTMAPWLQMCVGVLPSSRTAALTQCAPAMGAGGAQTEGILLVSEVLASAGG